MNDFLEIIGDLSSLCISFFPFSIREIEILFLALGTGYFIFTLFAVIVFLKYIEHTKLLDIIKVFLFGNKNNIIIKFFKVKLLIVIIFFRVSYFFLLKCISIVYLPWWTPTYLTIFTVVFDYIFGFIVLETGICVLFYLVFEYFGVESSILDYSFYSRLKKDFNLKFYGLLSNNVVNTMHHYGSTVKHNKIFGSTMHRSDGWSSGRRSKLSIRVNSDWYVKSDYYYEFKSYFSSHKKSDGALADKPRFAKLLHLQQNHFKSSLDYNKEVWIQTGKIDYEILNKISGSKDSATNQLLTLLINQAFVIKYNNDGSFPVLRADLGWVNHTIQKLGSAVKSDDFHFYVDNPSELFEFFEMFSSVISSKDFDLSNFSDSRVINNYFDLPAKDRASVLQAFAKQVRIASMQQEQQLIMNNAVGSQSNYPVSAYFGEELTGYHNSLKLMSNKKILGKSQSGFGDFIFRVEGTQILLELKDREDFLVFINNTPHFLDEVNIDTVQGATFFETLFSSNLPLYQIFKLGEEFGYLCRVNGCDKFSICVTNVRNILNLGVNPVFLQNGIIRVVAESDGAVIYEISEEDRIEQKLRNSSFYSPSQKLVLETYTRNLHAFSKGLAKYDVTLTRMAATRITSPNSGVDNLSIKKIKNLFF